jgi:hypothetical protein
MDRHQLTRISSHILTWGVAISVVASLFGNAAILLGAFLGVLLASLNWFVFRGLALKIVDGDFPLTYGVVIVLKTIAMLSAVAAVAVSLPVNIISYLVGLSVLPLGIVSFSIGFMFTAEGAMFREDGENA